MARTTVDASDGAARRELGRFLRARREQLTPMSAGVGWGSRRRVPGLRRSEVAELSGVSESWYTWLEQGRAVPSESVLTAVARALQLDNDQTDYVLSFGRAGHEGQGAHGEHREALASMELRQLVDALMPNPAFVIDEHWDFLAWNRSYAEFVVDPAPLSHRERNLLWVTFRWEPYRAMLVRWEDEARKLFGQFRARARDGAAGPRFAELVEDLGRLDIVRKWWGEHHVAAYHPAGKTYRHPTAGELNIRYVKLDDHEHPDRHVVVFLPVDLETAARFEASLPARPRAGAG